MPLKDDLIVYCNLTNPDINKVLGIYANNITYADRISQTLAKRNALKSHPALSNLLNAVTGTKGTRKAKIKITKCYDEFDKNKILEYLESENVKILEEEYIDLGTSIYIDSNSIISNSPESANANSEDENQREQLIIFLKDIEPSKRNATFKKLFGNNYKSFSELSLKQLELVLENL